MSLTTPDHRPDWDETWLTIASYLALRSLCVRDKVGCAIITKDNRPAALSYNGPPPNADQERPYIYQDGGTLVRRFKRPVVPPGPCNEWCPRAVNPVKSPDHTDCYSSHAEMNAIKRADFTDIQGGTVYISSTPCWTCARELSGCGLARAVFRVTPGKERDPDAALWVLESLGGMDVMVWGVEES